MQKLAINVAFSSLSFLKTRNSGRPLFFGLQNPIFSVFPYCQILVHNNATTVRSFCTQNFYQSFLVQKRTVLLFWMYLTSFLHFFFIFSSFLLHFHLIFHHFCLIFTPLFFRPHGYLPMSPLSFSKITGTEYPPPVFCCHVWPSFPIFSITFASFSPSDVEKSDDLIKFAEFSNRHVRWHYRDFGAKWRAGFRSRAERTPWTWKHTRRLVAPAGIRANHPEWFIWSCARHDHKNQRDVSTDSNKVGTNVPEFILSGSLFTS